MINGKTFKQWSEEVGFKNWKIEDMVNWCATNNQLDWLEATLALTIEHKTYPKVPFVNKNGKTVQKDDTTKEPVVSIDPISFPEVRGKFKEKFFATEKKEKKTFREKAMDLIAAARSKQI